MSTDATSVNGPAGMGNEWEHAFTILIPSFNRAHLLPRALESIAAQTYRDFELLVVDDGSTDDTHEVIEDWQRSASFPIRYIYQENQGKHAAHNMGVTHAKGFLTVILDSDDCLAPKALEIFINHWNMIPKSKRSDFAGVEGLCALLGSNNIAGTEFPEDVIDSTYLDMRRRYGVKGDKKNAIRTSVLRAFPFPQIPGERHIRPSFIWKRIALHYKFRFVNEIVQYIEYQPGGLSHDRFLLRMRNPSGYRVYFRDEIRLFSNHLPIRAKLRNHANYIRYSLHSGVGYRHQFREADSFWAWLAALPAGTLHWAADRLRMYRCGFHRAK